MDMIDSAGGPVSEGGVASDLPPHSMTRSVLNPPWIMGLKSVFSLRHSFDLGHLSLVISSAPHQLPRRAATHLGHHPLKLAHIFHHLLHLIKLIQHGVQFGDACPAAFGNALTAFGI
jgi:hypothetical protein